MPDLIFILVLDQNGVFHHFRIFAGFCLCFSPLPNFCWVLPVFFTTSEFLLGFACVFHHFRIFAGFCLLCFLFTEEHYLREGSPICVLPPGKGLDRRCTTLES